MDAMEKGADPQAAAGLANWQETADTHTNSVHEALEGPSKFDLRVAEYCPTLGNESTQGPNIVVGCKVDHSNTLHLGSTTREPVTSVDIDRR